MENKMDSTKEKKIISALMEIAMFNYDKGYLNECEKIFDAIKNIMPESGSPYIGMACTEIYKGNSKIAIKILQNAPHSDEEEKELCNCFLGKAFKEGGYDKEAQEILLDVAKTGTSTVAVCFAKSLLSVC
jgi:predicted Zn-dependent protease